VDHEGGRVQRFREGFTKVCAMGALGDLYVNDQEQARQAARASAVVLAYELLEVGIHLTYAPVLDINYGRNTVIGDRAFANNKEVIQILSQDFMEGLKAMGFATVGKHFPGHGWVSLDSHVACPVDERSMEEIEQQDMQTFTQTIDSIDWMMPAHVVYEKVHSEPAGFSKIWLQEILRNKLGFNGRIVSDDLSMAGAAVKGGYQARAQAALDAGCDILLACNSSEASKEILAAMDSLNVEPISLKQYMPNSSITQEQTERYKQALQLITDLDLVRT
jgi:beta-N-acetylhexosaminidase